MNDGVAWHSFPFRCNSSHGAEDHDVEDADDDADQHDVEDDADQHDIEDADHHNPEDKCWC